MSRANSDRSWRPRWATQLSRGFSLGFGWLVGVVFAAICCAVVALVLYRTIEVAMVAWADFETARQKAGGSVATTGQRPDTNAASTTATSGPTQARAAASEVEAHLPGQRGLEVTSTRFYYLLGRREAKPVLEIRVRNNTSQTLGRLGFCATLSSPDRTAPWAEDYFSYTIDGGLAPSEEATWELTPDDNKDWSRAPRHRTDLALSIVPIELENAQGQLVAETHDSTGQEDQDAHKTRSDPLSVREWSTQESNRP
ncbi:MAG TPA: hypothetical protein VJL29_09105 [Thermoguttaceae bacterium]|nr:hypothetical protein [Thermoguttaceae bacterium]